MSAKIWEFWVNSAPIFFSNLKLVDRINRINRIIRMKSVVQNNIQ
jgi:hypothetical protein